MMTPESLPPELIPPEMEPPKPAVSPVKKDLMRFVSYVLLLYLLHGVLQWIDAQHPSWLTQLLAPVTFFDVCCVSAGLVAAWRTSFTPVWLLLLIVILSILYQGNAPQNTVMGSAQLLLRASCIFAGGACFGRVVRGRWY
jgi:hypothetical protein